jgi:hypothetical protein
LFRGKACDLHAGVVVRAGERERLERLWRYTLRPPLALTRLRVDAEGQVCVALRHQWSGGTTHLRFDPITFLERLAVLIPRPRINVVLYYRVLAPRAPWRAAVVALAGSDWSGAPAGMVAAEGADVARATDNNMWIIRADDAGRTTEFVSAGSSEIIRPDGAVALDARRFAEDILVAEVGGPEHLLTRLTPRATVRRSRSVTQRVAVIASALHAGAMRRLCRHHAAVDAAVPQRCPDAAVRDARDAGVDDCVLCLP